MASGDTDRGFSGSVRIQVGSVRQGQPGVAELSGGSVLEPKIPSDAGGAVRIAAGVGYTGGDFEAVAGRGVASDGGDVVLRSGSSDEKRSGNVSLVSATSPESGSVLVGSGTSMDRSGGLDMKSGDS